MGAGPRRGSPGGLRAAGGSGPSSPRDAGSSPPEPTGPRRRVGLDTRRSVGAGRCHPAAGGERRPAAGKPRCAVPGPGAGGPAARGGYPGAALRGGSPSPPGAGGPAGRAQRGPGAAGPAAALRQRGPSREGRGAGSSRAGGGAGSPGPAGETPESRLQASRGEGGPGDRTVAGLAVGRVALSLVAARKRKKKPQIATCLAVAAAVRARRAEFKGVRSVLAPDKRVTGWRRPGFTGARHRRSLSHGPAESGPRI